MLQNRSFRCVGPVNLDLVKVTMESGGNAIYLTDGCTGRIGRIEVDTWGADGVKVHPVRDVVVESGYISCHARSGTVHQDGIQAQGGERITFRNLRIDCPTSPNAAFFVSSTGDGVPTDVVCESCTLLPANSTVNIKTSLRSGVRNSVVCQGKTAAIRIQEGAVSPVNEGNTILPRSDPRCASTS